MLSKVVNSAIESLLRPGMVFWVMLYVAVQSFFYFQPFIHSTAGSFYFLAVAPELFARDIIRTSSLGVTTSFYDVLHFILGKNLTNPYFLFWPYLFVCAMISAAVYKIGRHLSGGREEAGILLLILLLVQKGPVNGANLTLISADFHYQHFALPFILWSVYFLFREKYFHSGLLMAVAFYSHLKTPAAVTLALLPLWIYEIYKRPKIILGLIVPFLAVIPKVLLLAKDFYFKSGFTALEKKDYMDVVLHREGIEGSMYFNEIGVLNLLVFGLLTAVGIWLVRFIPDENTRRKVLFCQLGVLGALSVGTLVRIVDHFYGPLGEIVVMGYTRSTILGVLMTMGSAAVFMLNRLEALHRSGAGRLLAIVMAAIFFIGLNDFYFPEFSSVLTVLFSKKTLAKFIFSLLAAAVIFYIIHKSQRPWPVQKTVGLMLVVAVVYVLTKGGPMLYRAYQANYPFVPFVPLSTFFDKNLYDAKVWAAAHTSTEALFLTALAATPGEDDFCRGDFRIFSKRSVWCQDPTSMYGDPEAFREWKRRRLLLSQFLNRPGREWGLLLDHEKINYIVSSKNSDWPFNCQPVFENSSYVIYKVNKNWNSIHSTAVP